MEDKNFEAMIIDLCQKLGVPRRIFEGRDLGILQEYQAQLNEIESHQSDGFRRSFLFSTGIRICCDVVANLCLVCDSPLCPTELKNSSIGPNLRFYSCKSESCGMFSILIISKEGTYMGSDLIPLYPGDFVFSHIGAIQLITKIKVRDCFIGEDPVLHAKKYLAMEETRELMLDFRTRPLMLSCRDTKFNDVATMNCLLDELIERNAAPITQEHIKILLGNMNATADRNAK